MTQGAMDTHGATQGAPRYPAARKAALQLPALYTWMMQHRPVMRCVYLDERPTWIVADYEHARAVLTDPRFSADSTRPGFPMLGPAAAAPQIRTFTRMDNPMHDILRRMVTADFTQKRSEGLRARARELSHRLLDDLFSAGRPADFIQRVALPLPSLMICDILGVPYEDHEFFQEASLKGVSNDPDEVREGMGDLMVYLARLVSKKSREPGDDLIGRLLLESRGNDVLDHDGIVRIARQVLTGGHETTANNLGLFVLTFMLQPELRELALIDDAAMRRAVEELLRFHTVIQTGVGRVATEDVAVVGEQIAAGDGVIVCLAAANHDPKRFTGDPDVVELTRDARANVAFGFGIHQCLGQNLARVELQEGVRATLERFPDLRLAVPFEELTFKTDRIVYGLRSLPVTAG